MFTCADVVPFDLFCHFGTLDKLSQCLEEGLHRAPLEHMAEWLPSGWALPDALRVSGAPPYDASVID